MRKLFEKDVNAGGSASVTVSPGKHYFIRCYGATNFTLSLFYVDTGKISHQIASTLYSSGSTLTFDFNVLNNLHNSFLNVYRGGSDYSRNNPIGFLIPNDVEKIRLTSQGSFTAEFYVDD